ncbi:MAG TPA: hypothetical protein VHS53_11800, partial [Mucilaginibacter sp.]|nr:hypothetical protein [Mucilaginibacter sp.]
VVAKNGNVLEGVPCRLNWQSGQGISSSDIACQPDYGSEQILGRSDTKWLLTGGNKSGAFTLALEIPGVTNLSLTLPDNRLLSADINDELMVKIDPEPGDPIIFWRGQKRTINIVPRNHSSAMVGLSSYLVWGETSDLAQEHIISLPDWQEKQEIIENGAAWQLTGGESDSGLFYFHVVLDVFNTPLVLANNRLLSTDLNDEISLQIDGGPLPELVIFRRGSSPRLQLSTKNGSVLDGLACELDWQDGRGLTPADVSSQPGYGEVITLAEGKQTWDFQSSNSKSGMFSLVFNIAGFSHPLILENIRLLSVNLSDELPNWLNSLGDEKYFNKLVCIGSGNTLFRLMGGAQLVDIPFTIISSKGDSSISPAVGTPFFFTSASTLVNMTPLANTQGSFEISGQGFDGKQTVIWSSYPGCSEG